MKGSEKLILISSHNYLEARVIGILDEQGSTCALESPKQICGKQLRNNLSVCASTFLSNTKLVHSQKILCRVLRKSDLVYVSAK